MTLSDYLFLLRASAEALSPLGSHVMFYLAAAVSDFYIPENEMVGVTVCLLTSLVLLLTCLLYLYIFALGGT